MRGHRWLAVSLIVLGTGRQTGATGRARGVGGADPSAPSEPGTSVVQTEPTRQVTWADRHPLFIKPREYYDNSGSNRVVKAAAATVIGVPAGIIGEIRQIVVGAPPECAIDKAARTGGWVARGSTSVDPRTRRMGWGRGDTPRPLDDGHHGRWLGRVGGSPDLEAARSVPQSRSLVAEQLAGVAWSTLLGVWPLRHTPRTRSNEVEVLREPRPCSMPRAQGSEGQVLNRLERWNAAPKATESIRGSVEARAAAKNEWARPRTETSRPTTRTSTSRI